MSKDKNKRIKDNICSEYLIQMNHLGIQAVPEKVNDFLNELCERTILIKQSKSEEDLNSNIQSLIQFINANRELIGSDLCLKKLLRIHMQNLKDLFYGCFFTIDTELIENDESRINYSRNSNPEVIVDHIAQKIRYQLFRSKINRETGSLLDNNFDSKEDSLSNKAEVVTQRILRLAGRMGLVARGYKTEKLIDSEFLKQPNTFTIIDVDGKRYLLDCTFKQFFSLVFHKGLRALFSEGQIEESVGEKILSNPESAEVAKHILKYGWIEATPENIKLYLDTFVKSGFEYSEGEYLKKLSVDNKLAYFTALVRGEKKEYDRKTESLEHSYIIESEPLIIENFSEEEFNSTWDNSTIMDTLVQRERLRLSRMIGEDGKHYNIKEDNLREDCIISVRSIMEDCREKGITNKGIFTRDYNYKIGDDEIELPEDKGHYFTLAVSKGKLFLIDCTYRQFFSKTFNDESGEQHDPRNVYDKRCEKKGSC